MNDRTIGLVEHQRRGKGREMDMAAAGRRAVAAYSGVRLRR
jgi:predicted MarR family transcription regulator